MHELELAGIPSIDATRARRGARADFPLSRTAFIASIVVHVLAAYALSRQVWPGVSAPTTPTPEFFLFERPVPQPREAAPEEPAPAVPEEREPAPVPAPRAAEPLPAPTVVVEPPPANEPAPATEPAPTPRAYIDFDEERRRAANQVIGSREAEREYLTFSIDDVAPPRPEPEPEQRSIFDGTGGPRGPSVGQLGQARTKFGHRVSALCNALTGGGFSLMGWGSFCAGPADGEPSGLFPEVRPAYLDLMPECVDTRDTAPALALEAPFPTVKCRLVEQVDVGEEP